MKSEVLSAIRPPAFVMLFLPSVPVTYIRVTPRDTAFLVKWTVTARIKAFPAIYGMINSSKFP
jgi:hypothetical protein